MNPQLYENSIVAELCEDGETASRDKFFNAQTPNLAIVHERPEHRQMLWMKARGASNHEIAVKMGYTDSWVSQVLRQPWAQRLLLEEINNAGADELSTLLKGAAADSIFTLIELRDGEKTPAAVKRQSAVDLLDRFLGKPVQRVEQQIDQKIDVTSVEKIDEQLAALKQQETVLLGRN
jgi:hypothetical protein